MKYFGMELPKGATGIRWVETVSGCFTAELIGENLQEGFDRENLRSIAKNALEVMTGEDVTQYVAPTSS